MFRSNLSPTTAFRPFQLGKLSLPFSGWCGEDPVYKFNFGSMRVRVIHFMKVPPQYHAAYPSRKEDKYELTIETAIPGSAKVMVGDMDTILKDAKNYFAEQDQMLASYQLSRAQLKQLSLGDF